MHRRNIETRVFLMAVGLTLFGLLVFGILAFLNYTWIIGWMYGSFAIITSYSISILLMRAIFFKRRSKKNGLLFSLMRIGLAYFTQIGFILVLIAIDKHASGIGFAEHGHVDSVYGPINIFTYLGGISVVAIATVAAHIFHRKGE